jgi:DNA repair protein RadC
MLPREKLQKLGIESLDNNELIALILGHGNRNEDVFNISKRLLKEYGANPLVSITQIQKMVDFYKIGNNHAAKIIAAFELGKRMFRTQSNKQIKLMDAKDVFNYMKPITDSNKEYIYGLYLNTRNILIHEELLSIGTLESSSVQIRDIFYPAIINNAYSIILAHNHPSEDPSPSENDIYFTKEIEKAASILQISFLDHIILAKAAFYSFNDMN